jgi:hypothetical protein
VFVVCFHVVWPFLCEVAPMLKAMDAFGIRGAAAT